MSNLPKYSLLAYALVAICVTTFLYGGTLFLPFFFDDLVHLPFVDNYSFSEHWAGSNEAPYYRPLTFLLWKSFAVFTGSHNAPLHHGTNLVLHATNGWLLSLFCWRLSSNHQIRVGGKASTPYIFACLALLIYLLFPFHHQAIPWPGALSHILVTTLILGGLLAYINNRIVVALILTFVAPFAHENGVVLPALVFLLELIDYSSLKRDWFRLLIWPAIMSVPVAIWLIIRSFISTSRENQTLFPGFESIAQSGTWFFQGLAWPGTIFGRGLLGLELFNDLSIIWLTGCLSIGLALIVCYQSKFNLSLLVFGFGWWLAASAPAMLVLPFGYIVNSPRLLSLAGVGIAIFWSAVILELIDWLTLRQTSFKAGATLILGVFILAQGLAIAQISEANRFHTILGDAYKGAAEITEKLDSRNHYPVFINFPSSVAPGQKTFALGNEGVVFWPGYAPQHTIVTINGEIDQINQQFIQVDAIRSDQPYLYGIVRPTLALNELQSDPNAVFYNTVYEPNDIYLLPAGKPTERIDSQSLGYFSPDSAMFKIELFDLHSHLETVANQDFYKITIDWVAETGSAENVTVFLHAVSDTGELMAQADGDPVAGIIPLSSLTAGDGLTDIRHIPADLATVTLRLGLYDRVTGERIPFYNQYGERQSDDMLEYTLAK